jgi:hypothetical protein
MHDRVNRPDEHADLRRIIGPNWGGRASGSGSMPRKRHSSAISRRMRRGGRMAEAIPWHARRSRRVGAPHCAGKKSAPASSRFASSRNVRTPSHALYLHCARASVASRCGRADGKEDVCRRLPPFPYLLERGSASGFRKKVESCEPEGPQDSLATLSAWGACQA